MVNLAVDTSKSQQTTVEATHQLESWNYFPNLWTY